MSIFPEGTNEALSKIALEKIKPIEFESGLTLQFKSVTKVKSQYGASEDASIVEKGILEEGEQFVFQFVDPTGLERKLYSTSFPFVIAMHGSELNIGDWVHIKRTGKTTDTKYIVTKVAAPISQGNTETKPETKPEQKTQTDYPELGDGDIPF